MSNHGANTKHSAIIAAGESADSKFLISTVDQIIQIHKLVISSDGQSKVEYVGEITGDVHNALPILPTVAVYADGHVYIQGAVQGCGYQWDPKRVYKVAVGSGQVEVVEVRHSVTLGTPIGLGLIPEMSIDLSHGSFHRLKQPRVGKRYCRSNDLRKPNLNEIHPNAGLGIRILNTLSLSLFLAQPFLGFGLQSNVQFHGLSPHRAQPTDQRVDPLHWKVSNRDDRLEIQRRDLDVEKLDRRGAQMGEAWPRSPGSGVPGSASGYRQRCDPFVRWEHENRGC